MDLLTIGIYAAIGLIALYLFLTRNNNYWKDRGIPFIPPKLFFGHMTGLLIGKTPPHEFDQEVFKKYGRLFGGFEGSRPYLFVVEPDIIKDILIKDFQVFPIRRNFNFGDELAQNFLSILQGEAWKRVRTAVTPAFSSGKMRKMIKLIDDSATSTVANLEEAVSQKSVDMKKVFGAFTMDVIASTAFGIKLDSHRDPENPFVKHAANVFGRNLTLKTVLIFMFPKLGKIFGNSFVPKESTQFFKEITKKLIEERTKENQDNKRVDFLQLVMEADKNTEDSKTGPKGLSEIEILSQCILFFIAGYETTASTLCHAVHSLVYYPEIQDKLAKEINGVLKETNGELDYDILKKMPLLGAVIDETLRLYPAAPRLEREAVADYKLTNPPLYIPKGLIVGIPTYALHRDPTYFPNPDKFNPERFMPQNRDSINPNAYLPFGAGPRNCVAMRFALMEAKFCLARVLSKFRFSVSDDTKNPIQFFHTQGILVPTEVKLKVDYRK